jgi:predicted thioesterase
VRPGLERVDDFVVDDRLLTDVGGTIGARVLSTPGMIAMIERNAAILVFEHLQPGQAVAEGERTLGVGTHERRVISVPGSPPSP